MGEYFNPFRNKAISKVAWQLHYVIIFSKFEYGIDKNRDTYITDVNRIQVTQNKLSQFILELDKITWTNILHRNMGVLTLLTTMYALMSAW